MKFVGREARWLAANYDNWRTSAKLDEHCNSIGKHLSKLATPKNTFKHRRALTKICDTCSYGWRTAMANGLQREIQTTRMQSHGWQGAEQVSLRLVFHSDQRVAGKVPMVLPSREYLALCCSKGGVTSATGSKQLRHRYHCLPKSRSKQCHR